MTHWATLGLIKTLAEASDSSIILAARRPNAHKVFGRCKPDSRLANRLVGLAERNGDSATLLESVAEHHPDRTVKDKLSVLLSKCQVDPPVLYTWDTVLSFHHLLVATLIAYGTSLVYIHDAEDQKKQEYWNLTSILARLLSTILNSNAFANHLHFLHLNGMLPLPTSAAAEGYYSFAATYDFGLAKNDRRSKKYKAEGAEDGGADAEIEPNTDGGDENRAAETELNTGEDDEDPEFLSRWLNTKDAATVLSGWMKTFVSHYSAKRTLERYCYRNRQEEVEITLLAVGSEYRKISWEDMKQTITATLEAMTEHQPTEVTTVHEQPSITTAEIIEILEGKIRDAQPTDKHAKNIFWYCKRMIDGHPGRFWCRPHCETALAALSVNGALDNVSSATETDIRALKDLVKVNSVMDIWISMLTFHLEIEPGPCGCVQTLLSLLLDIFANFKGRRV